MTVYEIPNIEHCDVTTIGTTLYRITTHEGWYIHLATYDPVFDEDGNPKKVYKGAAILRTDYDFSLVEIVAETDLPDNAEILGGGDNNKHEVM